MEILRKGSNVRYEAKEVANKGTKAHLNARQAVNDDMREYGYKESPGVWKLMITAGELTLVVYFYALLWVR